MFTHYAMTGGRYGAKEKLPKLISNVQSMINYLFGEDLHRPELEKLFNSEAYLVGAKAVCGPDHPVIERVQVNLILMMPGMDLPMHYDVPWFDSE